MPRTAAAVPRSRRRIREAASREGGPGGAGAPPGLKILRKKRLFITKNVFFCCTKLKTCVPEAKSIKELDFDVKTRLFPPKSAENHEKRISEPKVFTGIFFPAWTNRKPQTVMKRVWPKFDADRSYV